MNESLEDYIHFISDAQETREKIDPAKESILLTLQKKKECEIRAMKTLEFLIEGKIRSKVFFRCIDHLNGSYYSDVIEERSITKLCGYCLCDNKIPTMPKSQYAIDSKNNKVYDVTNRKKYCSDYCYKASIHIEKQIDDSPLWLRNPKEFRNYTLLPTTDYGIPGDDLTSDSAVQKGGVPFESAYSFAAVSLQELTEEKPKEQEKSKASTNILVKENSKTVDDRLDSEKEGHKPIPISIKVKKSTKVKRKNKIQLIKQYALEWLTPETYVFLFGEEKVKEVLTELDLSHIPEASVDQQKDLAHLYKRLSFSDSTDHKIERTLLEKQLKEVPSYNKIKKENKDIKVKVRSFYSGSTYEVNAKNGSKATEGTTTDIVPVGEPPNVIRQNVFLNSIKNAMKVLTDNLDISWVLALKQLEVLVKTFTLQPHSVVFQPVEWNLIALILIKMLSFHDAAIMEQLNTPKSVTFINASVVSFPGIQSMLSELFENIEDIKSFLNRYFCVEKKN